MTKSENNTSAPAEQGPHWVEEWIQLALVIRHGPLQVRHKLDAGAVRRYRDMTQAGKEPPPIKVGRLPDGRLFLVDGWHRLEAGAVQLSTPLAGTGNDVLALVADLSEAEVRWESARANMDHGVPLKRSELRRVFGAFIRAGKHKKPRGGLLSYRELSKALGIGHTTLRNWMMQDFPATARDMGGTEHGNSEAEQAPAVLRTLAEEQHAAALEAARNALAALPGMSAHLRYTMAQQWRAVLAEADRLGTEAPMAEEF